MTISIALYCLKQFALKIACEPNNRNENSVPRYLNIDFNSECSILGLQLLILFFF